MVCTVYTEFVVLRHVVHSKNDFDFLSDKSVSVNNLGEAWSR